MGKVKIAAWVAGVSVSLLSGLALYGAHGPIGSEPIVLTLPTQVMDVVCPETRGCYKVSIPDFILLTEKGVSNGVTIHHETLHYNHPDWSECEVSNYLFETQGLSDSYHDEGACE